MATMNEYKEALAYADKQRTEAEMLKPADFSSKLMCSYVHDDGGFEVYFGKDIGKSNVVQPNEIPQFLDFCRWGIATFGEGE